MLSLCVGCSYGFSAFLLLATSEGGSTVRGHSLLGGDLALRLDLLQVSGKSDKQDSLEGGLATSAQAWDPHLSPWAASLERFRYISPGTPDLSMPRTIYFWLFLEPDVV